MVTVLIPTAKRPELLATALRSVSEQTALKEVAEIVVSESAGDSRSGEVCKQFPHLPIRYIYRDPQMHMIEHFSALKKATWTGEYTVMLHDDDWWTPDYISKGIAALDAHPEASTFCCNSFYIANEHSSGFYMTAMNLFFWFGANFPSIAPLWEMSEQDVLLACLENTPVHYSTIMGRAEAFRRSTVVYETANKWDVDRMFIYELSRYGSVVYSPIPYAFYRIHGEQLTRFFSMSDQTRQCMRTTEWLVERSGKSRESLAQLLYKRIKACPPGPGLGGIYHNSAQPWCLPLLTKDLDPHSELVKFNKKIHTQVRVKSLVKPFLSPFVLERGKALRRAFKR